MAGMKLERLYASSKQAMGIVQRVVLQIAFASAKSNRLSTQRDSRPTALRPTSAILSSMLLSFLLCLSSFIKPNIHLITASTGGRVTPFLISREASHRHTSISHLIGTSTYGLHRVIDSRAAFSPSQSV